ncbi:hypothetical protein [Boudabousia marimammalium]|uniref:Uncharacterized protein n=1 Tax=Boudabousia marimammalium TaxID=156892 RepID=A0A1Q5PSA9_9ACTO|nr:hypothetical protein [Boudabousia marimammalium]OKL50461.1 hypothetical protein BM477_00335 [Boudabousia marimammalium]
MADMVVADLKIPSATDPEKLASSLRGEDSVDGLQVAFFTYQSIDTIHDAQELVGIDWRDFDLNHLR